MRVETSGTDPHPGNLYPAGRSAFATGLIAALLLAACTSCHKSEVFPPRTQLVMPSGPEPAANGEHLLVAMSDPDADALFLGDVFTGLDRAESRFTGLHPQFLLQAADVTGLDF
jgi:hypothetical protein